MRCEYEVWQGKTPPVDHDQPIWTFDYSYRGVVSEYRTEEGACVTRAQAIETHDRAPPAGFQFGPVRRYSEPPFHFDAPPSEGPPRSITEVQLPCVECPLPAVASLVLLLNGTHYTEPHDRTGWRACEAHLSKVRTEMGRLCQDSVSRGVKGSWQIEEVAVIDRGCAKAGVPFVRPVTPEPDVVAAMLGWRFEDVLPGYELKWKVEPKPAGTSSDVEVSMFPAGTRIVGAQQLVQIGDVERSRDSSGNQVDRYLYKLDTPAVFGPGLPMASRRCDLDWCDKTFMVVDGEPEFSHGLSACCSELCLDSYKRVRDVVDRHNDFVDALETRAASLANPPPAILSERNWSLEQTRAEYSRLQRAWLALQHEAPEGDPRHFALIDNEDE